MRRWAMIAAAAVVGLCGAALAVLLALAFSPAGESLRHRMAEQALSHYWGEPVKIEGSVELDLWPRLAVTLNEISSTTFEKAPVRVGMVKVQFASWLRLPFDQTVFSVHVDKGRFEFPLSTDEDTAPGTLLSSPVAFFSLLPRLRLDDVVFDFADAANGWRFTLDIGHVLSRLNDGVEYLDAKATLNGVPITLAFRFDRVPRPPEPGMLPYGARLSASGAGLSAELRTRSSKPEFDETLLMTLTAKAASVADLLSLAGIARALDGTADLTTQLMADAEQLAMRGLALDFHFKDQSHINITGGIGDVFDGTGVDLHILAEVDTQAKAAVSLRDVVLTRLSGQFQDAPHGGVMLSGAVIETNAFSQNLKEIGPIDVAAIRRDEDGHVALSGITVQAGSEAKPLFRLSGDISDILALSGISLTGDFNLPLSDILVVPAATADRLGRLAGVAAVSDADGVLRFTSLTAAIEDSTLLSGKVTMAPPTPGAAEQHIVDASLDVPHLATLAAALGTTSRFTGPVGFSGRITRDLDSVGSSGRLTLGRTQVDGTLTAKLRNDRPFIAGKLTSPDIHADELFTLLGTGDQGLGLPPLAFVGLSAPAGGSQLDLSATSDFDIAVEASRIEGDGGTGSGLSARLLLDNGAFRADPVNVSFAGGRIHAALTEAGAGRMRAKGTGEGWPLGTLLGKPGGYAVSGSASVTFDLTANPLAKGNPMTTVDGTATAHVTNAQLGTGLLDLAGVGLLNGLFTASVLQGKTLVRCVQAPLRFTAGDARTDPAMVVETENIIAVARGSIDLARDTIDLVVVPRPLGAAANWTGYPFSIKGKLATPAIALESGVVPALHTAGGCQ